MATSKKESWTTHEGACTNCRTRKIRCGREKPQCSSCCRDQVDCVYSSPPKRVNHVKVLFDDIQDRLITMQGELSWLTATLKRSDNTGRLELDSERDLRVSSPFHSGDNAASFNPAGHLVRDGGTKIERYYGPFTLVALSRSFQAGMASHIDSSNNKVVGGLINKILLDSTFTDDENLDPRITSAQLETSTCLPPRQLLSVVLDNFLNQADYRTDIFCRQTIYEAVERVYKEPSSPTSEPWALCFNLIILLTLGAEHPVDSDDPFVRPMLEAAHVTAKKPGFLMSPCLVNVQALALFSLLPQQYHTDDENLGASIFAQACILAREMGLHQVSHGLAPSPDLSASEAEERQKVFRSLYVRDRYSATACGVPTWLPSMGHKGLPPMDSSTVYVQGGNSSDQPHINYTPHWDLANLQDELDRLLNSASASEMSTSERRIALGRLQHSLEIWTQKYQSPSPTRPTTVDGILLHLAFLGTRIRVLESENITGDAAHSGSAQALHDARLSCLIIATSSNSRLNQALADQLDRLLNRTGLPFSGEIGTHSSSTVSSPASASSPSYDSTSSSNDAPQPTGPLTPPPSSSGLGKATDFVPLPLHRLINVFPTAAVFVLARHILGIDIDTQSSQSAPTAAKTDERRQQEINQDISILEALLVCFRSVPSPSAAAARGKTDSDAQRSRLGRIIQHLVDIIRAIVGTTDHCGPDDHDSHDEDVYAPKPLLASTDPLHSDASSNAMTLPDLSLYGSGYISPSHLGLPPTPSSSRSTWAPPEDPLSSSATPLFAQASLHGPSITPMEPTIPDMPFNMSQFLHQMGISTPGLWDSGQGQTELQMQPQPQPQMQTQAVPETTRRRSKKRPRTDGSRNQDEHGRYRPGGA